MKRVKIPKYQVKALDKAIEKYKEAVKAKSKEEFMDSMRASGTCPLCTAINSKASATCEICVYGKSSNKNDKEVCTKTWNALVNATSFITKLNYAKQILKELRWIKRYQL